MAVASDLADVLIRPAALEDRSFIIDAWLRSYRNSDFGRRIPDDVWGTRYGHAGFVEDRVNENWTQVACLQSDPLFIFGFAVYGVTPGLPTPDAPINPRPWVALHYVYVKRDYREKNSPGTGVARHLVTDAGASVVTAETPAWKGFAAKHGIAYEYRHPYRKDR